MSRRMSTSERANSAENYIENRDEVHSNTLSKQRSEINNVLRMSVKNKSGDPSTGLTDIGL